MPDINIAIYPYMKGSRSVKELCGVLPKAVRFPSKMVGRDINVLINWGFTGQLPALTAGTILNPPEKLAKVSSKTKMFNVNNGVARTPQFTTDIAEAVAWREEGLQVLGRTDKGMGGAGIVFFEDNPGAWSASDFWSVYKKKKAEFRVHIMKDNAFLIQKKVLRTSDPLTGGPIDTSNVDFRIRSHLNGFIFQRENVNAPADVITQAKLFFKQSGLDFGAVDVIYNQAEDKAYCLEINTAPGIEGQTVQDYVDAFRRNFGIAA